MCLPFVKITWTIASNGSKAFCNNKLTNIQRGERERDRENLRERYSKVTWKVSSLLNNVSM